MVGYFIGSFFVAPISLPIILNIPLLKREVMYSFGLDKKNEQKQIYNYY
jgi:hypothetical protein